MKVSIAMAHAGIGCWDAKFAYDLWRSIHAIRLAGADGNANTTPEAGWTPLDRRTTPDATPLLIEG